MDPISALIAGGASLLGGFMNTSSQQAINAQNLQQQMFMATGGYLPGLVQNAAKAGLSPLAVLGQHAPIGGTATPIGAGEGVAGLGKALSQIKDPHTLEMEKIETEKGKTAVELGRQEVSNRSIEGAVNKYILGQITGQGPGGRWIPPGWQEGGLAAGGRAAIERLGSHPFPNMDDVIGGASQQFDRWRADFGRRFNDYTSRGGDFPLVIPVVVSNKEGR